MDPDGATSHFLSLFAPHIKVKNCEQLWKGKEEVGPSQKRLEREREKDAFSQRRVTKACIQWLARQ